MNRLRKITLSAAVALLASAIALFGISAAEPSVPFVRTGTNLHCPMIYRPVTAMKAGRCVWYSNACLAKADGAVVVPDGICGFRSSNSKENSAAENRSDAMAGKGPLLSWPWPWKKPLSSPEDEQPGRVRIRPGK